MGINPLVQMGSPWHFSKMLGCCGKGCYDFFEYFHQHSMLDQSMSAYFLTLIPKKSNAVNIKDFHPISLVGSVYKFLS